MKKLIVLVVAVAILFAMAACQPKAEVPENSPDSTDVAESEAPQSSSPDSADVPETETKVLCFVMPNATHGFMAAAIQAADDALEAGKTKYKDVETRLITSADASEQNNQIDTLINDKVDTIVLWPHNGDDLRSGAQKVLENGIPLIVFDRLISGIEPTCEADMDNFEYGASSAEYLNGYFKDRLDAGEKIQVLEFKGDNSTASTVRSDGFNAKKYADIEVVQSFSTDWQRAKSMEFMETLLTNSEKDYIESINAIFTHDGEITQGIMDAMENYQGPASLANIKTVAGMAGGDYILESFKPLLDKFGITQRCVYVTPGCAKVGVDLGFEVVAGNQVDKVVKIGYIEITTDNYQSFIDDPSLLNMLD